MTTAPPRSDQLVHPLARQVMARVEELQALAVDSETMVFVADAAARANAAGQPLTDEERADAARLGRTRAQMRADEELDQLVWLAQRTTVEQKARDQQRWAADARPGEPCPTCGAVEQDPAGHRPFAHQVADEQGEPGYRPCGCNPDEHDHIGACVRVAGHHGACVAADPAAGPPQLIAFACRADDAVPHPAVV